MSIVSGKITNVYESFAGSELTAGAVATDTVLLLADASDFDSTGGSLIIGGVIKTYTTCDYDLDTVTLSAALGTTAAAGDEVNISPRGTVRWAMIDSDDGDEGNRAIVPYSMKDRIGLGVRDEADQESVAISDETGRWVVSAVDGEIVIITGTIIQTAEDTGPGQQGMRIMADTAGGILQFWTGVDPSEGAGYLNPYAASGGNPSFRIAGGTINVAGRVFPTPAQIDFIAGNGRGTVVFGGMTDAGAGVTGYTCDVSVSGTIGSSGDISAGQAIFGSGSVIVGGDILRSQNPPTTTGTVNVNWSPTNGNLRVNNSLSKNKLEQQPLDEESIKGVLRLSPKSWFDRTEVEENDGSTEGLRRIPGLIAEDVEAHAPELSLYDINGKLQGVAYDRVSAYLIVIIRDQQEKINSLEARLATLEDRIS